MITLDKVLEKLNEEGLLERYSKNIKFEKLELNHLSYNSKEILEKTLFICKGKMFKSEYLKGAIVNGTVAYLSETYYEEVPENVAYIIVKDIRKAMTIVSNLFYGYAWKDISVVGITGTKGKTTTTYYLKNIITKYLGKRCGIISTIDTYSGITDEVSHLTTPESPDLHRLFYETKQSDIPILIMEVTSQAYKTGRVDGINFDIGAFLNVSEDHISDIEHPDFEDYLNCKLELMKNSKTAIINKNSEFFNVIKEAAKNAEKIITYGIDVEADYSVNDMQKDGKYTMFKVKGPNGYEKTYRTSVVGKFNVENATAAIAISRELGIDDESIAYGIENTSVQGRMNVFEKNGVTVIVDFAHNRLSFEKLYEAIKLDYPNSRIISLAGGVGGKAFNRRKDFGEIVGKYSDYIYLTTDDPQFEDVTEICLDMASYIENCGYEIIINREEAVKKALESAKPGDVVVLLGKGEEEYQKTRGELVPYISDLKLAEIWSKT